jgi:hypothetical protein
MNTRLELLPLDQKENIAIEEFPRGFLSTIIRERINRQIANKARKIPDFFKPLPLDRGSLTVHTTSVYSESLDFLNTRTMMIWLNKPTADGLARTVVIGIDWSSEQMDDRQPHIRAYELKRDESGEDQLKAYYDSNSTMPDSFGAFEVSAVVSMFADAR